MDLSSDLPPSAALSPSSYVREVYRYIKLGIQAGHFAPGQRLHEVELAKLLSVSRTPVREALHSLAAHGIVDAVHNVGFVVRILTRSQLRESFELRGVVEAYAAKQAALRVDDEQLWEIEQAIVQAERLNLADTIEQTELVRLASVSLRFHELVAEASGNEYVVRTVMGLSVRPLVYRASYWYSTDDRRHSDTVHRQILDALRSHDADLAGNLLMVHTQEIADLVIAGLDANPQFVAQEATAPAPF